MKTDSGFIPVGTAATIAGVTTETVRRWMDSGRIHGYRTPGGQRRVARSDIDAITENRPITRSVPELEHPAFAVDALRNTVGEWRGWKPNGYSGQRIIELRQGVDEIIASLEDLADALSIGLDDLDIRTERLHPTTPSEHAPWLTGSDVPDWDT